jgi:hypothetical protein
MQFLIPKSLKKFILKVNFQKNLNKNELLEVRILIPTKFNNRLKVTVQKNINKNVEVEILIPTFKKLTFKSKFSEKILIKT